MRWNDLVEEVEEDVKSRFPEILNSRYYQDELTEIVDSAIPVYNSDRIDLLADNHSLAEVDDYGLLPESPSVYDIIATAIYEQLLPVASDAYEEEKENWAECEECGEWKSAAECELNEKAYEVFICNECLEKLSFCESCSNKTDFEELQKNEDETSNRYCDKCREDED